MNFNILKEHLLNIKQTERILKETVRTADSLQKVILSEVKELEGTTVMIGDKEFVFGKLSEIDEYLVYGDEYGVDSIQCMFNFKEADTDFFEEAVTAVNVLEMMDKGDWTNPDGAA